MKKFPVPKLKPTEANISSEIVYNPYSDIPPTLWHSIAISIQPIELGADAAEPEIETAIDSNIDLDGIVIPPKNRDELAGRFTPDPNIANGSFYVTNCHNPISIHSITLRRIAANSYAVSADLLIHFEFEASGYSDAEASLNFTAEYSALRFCIPQWREPDKVRFPESWQIPDEWTEGTIAEFISRFVDLRRYEPLSRERNIVRAKPRVA